MKKLIILLLFVVGCNDPQTLKKNIEYFNSPEHLENDYPFSEATIVNDIIYVSGQIGTSENGEVVAEELKLKLYKLLKILNPY